MKSFIECLPLEDMTASIESHPLEDMSTTDELRQTVTNFFDCTDGLAKLPYKLWRIWHPCSAALPAWLHSCDVYHIAKQRFPPLHHVLHVPASNAMETSLISSVHALYHSIAAECADDSLVCSKLLSTCHTLVVAYPDDTATTRKAVAAISFVLHHPTVVIMYVGVDEEFRAGGLGILLLLLAGKCCIPPLQKVVTCAMMVRVHTEGHSEARRFFENRGFKLSTVTSANRGMPLSVAEIVHNTPWMKQHVMNDTNSNADADDAADAADAADADAADVDVDVDADVNAPSEWLWLELPAYCKLRQGAALSNSYALLPPECVKAFIPSNQQIDQACFCALVSHTAMTNAQVNWCVNGLLLWDQDCFKDSLATSQDAPVCWHYPCQLSWRERLQLRGQCALTPAVMMLLLSCMMRNATMPLWQEHMFIVSPIVLRHAHRMQSLFQQYLQTTAALQRDDNTAPHFHAILDTDKFLSHAAVVMAYICEQAAFLARPSVCAVCQEVDGNWTCLMMLNTSHYQAKTQPQHGAPVCGFVYFDPCAAGAEYDAASIHPSNPTLFIMTMAKALQSTTTASSNLDMPFTDMKSFQTWYASSPHKFGNGISSHAASWFNGDDTFVQIQLPVNYPLRCDVVNAAFQSGWMCLLFVVDWCVMVGTHRFEWQHKGNVKPVMPKDGLWRFPIPKTFGMGQFLRKKVGLQLRRSPASRKTTSSTTAYLPIASDVEALCVQSIIALCDRLMFFSGRSTECVRQQPYYTKYLKPTAHATNNFVNKMKENTIIVDQSGFGNWTSQLQQSNADNAANMLLSLSSGNQSAETISEHDDAKPPAITIIAVEQSGTTDLKSKDNKQHKAKRSNSSNSVQDNRNAAEHQHAVESENDVNNDGKNNNDDENVDDSNAEDGKHDNNRDAENSDVYDQDTKNSANANSDAEGSNDDDSNTANSDEDNRNAANDNDGTNNDDDIIDDSDVEDSNDDNNRDAASSDVYDQEAENSDKHNSDADDSFDDDSKAEDCEDSRGHANVSDNDDSKKEENAEYNSDAEKSDDDDAHSEDSNDANNNSGSSVDTNNDATTDFAEEVPAVNMGQLAPITGAIGMQRKRRRGATRLPASKSIKLTPEELEYHAQKLRELQRQETLRKMTNHDCCATNKCRRPGGSTKLDPDDVARGCDQSCSRCEMLGHYICMQRRSKKLYCLLCLESVKLEHPPQPRAPPKAVTAGLEIPHVLRSHVLNHQLPWEIPHCKDEMNHVIAHAMQRLNYKSWAEMRTMVAKQNRANATARRLWQTWTKERRAQHKQNRNQVAAERLEYVKAYRALQKEYLRTTPSVIPDLRYDKVKKLFIGRAEWKSDDNGRTLINQQEVELSARFVQRHFPLRVVKYVRRVSLMSRSNFVPVPKLVTLSLDVRVITHCKWQPVTQSDVPECVLVKYSDQTQGSMTPTEVQSMFGAKYVAILRQSAGRGFIHIPPGQAKCESLEEAPVHTEWCKQLAIRYPQGHLATCVFSGFASALWAVGLEGMAMLVKAAAPCTMDDPSVLAQLAKLISSTPGWLLPHKIKHAATFDLLRANLTGALAVVILKASDGTSSHAITVHDNVIFDSNEKTALPLCQANLNYLCSTQTRQANYHGVMAGYLFYEHGKKQNLLKSKQSMPTDPWRCRTSLI